MTTSLKSRALSALVALSLTVVPMVAQALQSVSVPLYHVVDEAGNYRLGFYASLGTSPDFKLYELDTGSSGTFAAYNSEWWPSFRFVRKVTNPQRYESGVVFYFDVVSTVVDLGGGARTGLVHVGKITQASGNGIPPSVWNNLVKEGKPPLHGVFFGNMGSGLSSKDNIFAVLAQMPGNLKTGFVIRTLGYITNENPKTPVQQGELVIGLTDQIRSRFEIQVPMAALTKNGTDVTFPSGYLCRDQYGLSLNVSISDGVNTYTSAARPTLLDSGAPTATLYELLPDFKVPDDLLNNKKTALKNGVTFQVSADSTGSKPEWIWNLTTGSVKSLNKIGVSPTKAVGEDIGQMNLGIIPYYTYEVMFDIQNGVVGLHRIPAAAQVGLDGNRKSIITSQSTYVVRGTATSPTGISAITYQVNDASPKNAKGNAHWNFRAQLAKGTNTVVIRAFTGTALVTTTVVKIKRLG